MAAYPSFVKKRSGPGSGQSRTVGPRKGIESPEVGSDFFACHFETKYRASVQRRCQQRWVTPTSANSVPANRRKDNSLSNNKLHRSGSLRMITRCHPERTNAPKNSADARFPRQA